MSKILIVVIIILAGFLGWWYFMSPNSTSTSTTTTTTTTTETPPTTGKSIEIKDFKYGPATLTVKAGEQITVVNKDSMGHSVTADDGSFDSGVLDKDGFVVMTAPTQPGTYKFHCTPHPSIQGTLIVE